MEHRTNHEPTEEEWGEFARQASKKKDPDKTIEAGERTGAIAPASVP